MDESDLYEFYRKYIYNDKKLEETISELRKLHELTKLEVSLDYHNIKEFDLNSFSWQVRDAKANGHYEFVSNCTDSEGNIREDKFVYKNMETGVKYLVDKEALYYLTAFKDHQDYRFIYIGYCGGYPSISL